MEIKHRYALQVPQQHSSPRTSKDLSNGYDEDKESTHRFSQISAQKLENGVSREDLHLDEVPNGVPKAAPQDDNTGRHPVKVTQQTAKDVSSVPSNRSQEVSSSNRVSTNFSRRLENGISNGTNGVNGVDASSRMNGTNGVNRVNGVPHDEDTERQSLQVPQQNASRTSRDISSSHSNEDASSHRLSTSLPERFSPLSARTADSPSIHSNHYLDGLDDDAGRHSLKVPSKTTSRTSRDFSLAQPNIPEDASSSDQLPESFAARRSYSLQVPKAQSTSRASRDYSFTQANNSEEAMSSGGRRASFSLGRRGSRSINSDLHLDGVPQDERAARYAAAILSERVSKRRRMADHEDDDLVLVGKKVDKDHASWTTMYHILTGIRHTVSRTNAKLDRGLTEEDYQACYKYTFRIDGSELTPSVLYDFKFKDYAPWVFRRLRASFDVDPADYLMSLTDKYILSELGSPGKSGSFFYFSKDYRYIIKTIHKDEAKRFRIILRDYYNHVEDNPNTLLSQFYGLHRVKASIGGIGRKIHFVVMANLFPPHRDIHETYDLKGSTIGREYKEDELDANPRAVLKDLNWLRRKKRLELGPVKKEMFSEQLRKDAKLLQRLNIMDYSLLVGVHDKTRGNTEKIRNKTLRVFTPMGDDPVGPTGAPLMRTPSTLESMKKAREMRRLVSTEIPRPIDQTTVKLPDEMPENLRHQFYADEGGLRASDEHNRPGNVVYYLGVIDIFTHVSLLLLETGKLANDLQYGLTKKIEHFFKSLNANSSQISAVPPTEYCDRFTAFLIDGESDGVRFDTPQRRSTNLSAAAESNLPTLAEANSSEHLQTSSNPAELNTSEPAAAETNTATPAEPVVENQEGEDSEPAEGMSGTTASALANSSKQLGVRGFFKRPPKVPEEKKDQ
jgi:Phosphatidylinositol-4-phosphate 5-Kinase